MFDIACRLYSCPQTCSNTWYASSPILLLRIFVHTHNTSWLCTIWVRTWNHDMHITYKHRLHDLTLFPKVACYVNLRYFVGPGTQRYVGIARGNIIKQSKLTTNTAPQCSSSGHLFWSSYGTIHLQHVCCDVRPPSSLHTHAIGQIVLCTASLYPAERKNVYVLCVARYHSGVTLCRA